MSGRGRKRMREIVGQMKGVEKLGKCPVERPIDLRKKVLQSVAALDLSGLGGVSHVGYGGAWVIPWKREIGRAHV